MLRLSLPTLRQQSRWSAFSDSVHFTAIDFFHDRLPSADVILLDSILADWSDAECICILKNIKKSLVADQTALIISELTVFSPINSVDVTGKLLLAYAVSGRVRSPQEVIYLMSKAGFSNCSICSQSHTRFTVIGYP